MDELYSLLLKLGVYARKRITQSQLKDLGVWQQVINATNFLHKDARIVERLYAIKHGLKEKPTCLTCGKDVKFKDSSVGYRQFCSRQCKDQSPLVKEKVKQTCLTRYGVTNSFQLPESIQKANLGKKTDQSKEKRKNTCLKKYGVEYNSQAEEIKKKKKKTCQQRYGIDYSIVSKLVKEKTKSTCLEKYQNQHFFQSAEFKEKAKQTCLGRYGVPFYSLTEEFREKSQTTCQEKYGVTNPFQSPKIKEKIQSTLIEKYGVDHPSRAHLSPEVLSKLSNKDWLFDQHYNQKKSLEEISDRLGVTNKTVWNYFQKYELKVQRFPKSAGEQEIINFLQSIGISNIQTNNRSTLDNQEIDIWLPDHNLGIEYNGSYWHSDQHKEKLYHVKKYLKAREKGVKLIQVFEDQWKNKQDIVKNRLQSLLNKSTRIYARKCKVENISSSEYKIFTERYHLQGHAAAKYKLGLFHNDELVAVMSFSKPRYSDDIDYELIRYCSKGNVVGGASKLFKHFIKKVDPDKIISYADRCWSPDGKLYTALGFVNETDDELNVGYFYVLNGIRRHRSNFNKKKLVQRGYDPNKTESEIMREIGAFKIYDAGQHRFIWYKQS